MALVLAERDYKLLTLFLKVFGVFTWAAGSISIFTHGRVLLGLGLILLGTLIVLAPLPISVVRPDSVDDDGEGLDVPAV